MAAEVSEQTNLPIRGLYGGIPVEWFQQDLTLDDFGVNAVWIGSGGLTSEGIALLHSQGARAFAEFNTLHEAGYLQADPDAAPVGADGAVCPPPDGWQGLCPTHAGYRRYRMEAFRSILQNYPLDGIWLDYHHSHASWEQAVPNLPDTCFCDRCLTQFRIDTGVDLPRGPIAEVSAWLLGELPAVWTQWRCGIFTDWVREFYEILQETRPGALLGTFHCPWSESDHGGALKNKLAIDLKAQSCYLDVFSIMPYQTRFGHADDLDWVSRQVAWLGQYLNIRGVPGEQKQIWPIVQLSDWGGEVTVEEVPAILKQGAQAPATGVIAFAWGSLRGQPEKVDAMGHCYRGMRT